MTEAAVGFLVGVLLCGWFVLRLVKFLCGRGEKC